MYFCWELPLTKLIQERELEIRCGSRNTVGLIMVIGPARQKILLGSGMSTLSRTIELQPWSWRRSEPRGAENVTEPTGRSTFLGLSHCCSWLHGVPKIAIQLLGFPIGLSEQRYCRHGTQGVTAPLPLELSTQETVGLFSPPLKLLDARSTRALTKVKAGTVNSKSKTLDLLSQPRFA